MSEGEPILAVRAGYVYVIRNADMTCNISTSLGNIVIVRHIDSIPDSNSTRPSGWSLAMGLSSYLHVRHDIPVKIGDHVAQGQVVAYTSCTGQDGGSPHLHFEVNLTTNPPHCGTFPDRPDYCFTSVPSPFVECTVHPNGLTEEGDRLTSQNVLVSGIEKELAKPGTQVLNASMQVFPNPLRSKTDIIYSLSETQEIDLSVFDVRGKRMARAAFGQMGSRVNASGNLYPETSAEEPHTDGKTPAGKIVPVIRPYCPQTVYLLKNRAGIRYRRPGPGRKDSQNPGKPLF